MSRRRRVERAALNHVRLSRQLKRAREAYAPVATYRMGADGVARCEGCGVERGAPHTHSFRAERSA